MILCVCSLDNLTPGCTTLLGKQNNIYIPTIALMVYIYKVLSVWSLALTKAYQVLVQERESRLGKYKGI